MPTQKLTQNSLILAIQTINSLYSFLDPDTDSTKLSISRNVNIVGDLSITGNFNSSVTVSSAVKLTSARTLSITGDVSYTSPAFDGSSDVSAVATLATVGTPVVAAFVKPTTDAKGRVIATTAVTTADITALVGTTYVSKAGDTVTGSLNVNTGLQVGVNSVTVTTGGLTPLVQIGGASTGSAPSDVLLFPGFADVNQKQLRIQMNQAGQGYLGMGTALNTLIFGSTSSVGSMSPSVWLSLTSIGTTVSGNLSVAGSSSLNALSATTLAITGALSITGSTGTAGQVLTSAGSGNTPTWSTIPGSGTVTSVSIVSANGVSGTVATASTTPAITLTLGAITPSSVVSTGALSGTNLTITGSLSANATTGVAGQVLTSNGAGAATWTTVRDIPQNSKSLDYTTVLADAGGHLLHPTADTTARTYTIPANSAVAYPIGTALTFVNQNSAGGVTIAITTDTMRLAGTGTTGSRSLTANGIATALKIAATEWIISGTGLA